MTTAQNISIYNGFAESKAAKAGNLRERIHHYFMENAVYFITAAASLNRSSYGFYKYVLPGLTK